MSIQRIAAATFLSLSFLAGAGSLSDLGPPPRGPMPTFTDDDAAPVQPGFSPEARMALEILKAGMREKSDFRNAAEIHTIAIMDGIEDAQKKPSVKLPDLYGLDMG